MSGRVRAHQRPEPDGLEDEYGPVPLKEAVLAEEFVPVVKAELERRTRIWGGLGASLPGLEPLDGQLSPLTLLCLNTGIAERSISRVLTMESAVIDFTWADTVMMALGMSLSQYPEMIVDEKEARYACIEQGKLMQEITRARGEFVPLDKEEKRKWGGTQRRKLTQERLLHSNVR